MAFRSDQRYTGKVLAVFKTTKWNEGRSIKPQYAILEVFLNENPNFNNLDKLTKDIENELKNISNEIINEIKKKKLLYFFRIDVSLFRE
jgi:uncharacterized protein Yka (UPF0111/DUF47 family)